MAVIGVVLIIAIGLCISLAIFSLFVAVGTHVVKRVWYSGNTPPRRTFSNGTTYNYNNTNQNNYKYRSQSDGKIHTATGWVWNENTKLWEPPDAQAKHDKKGLSYEEWKASQEHPEK